MDFKIKKVKVRWVGNTHIIDQWTEKDNETFLAMAEGWTVGDYLDALDINYKKCGDDFYMFLDKAGNSLNAGYQLLEKEDK